MKNTIFTNFTNGKAIVIAAAIALLFGIICIISGPAGKSDDTLIVGMMSGWAPFMTINNQGIFEGFDVDVSQELATRMNKKLVIKDLGAVAPCLIALEQNKIDMVLSGLDITQKRRDTMEMIWYTGQDTTSFSLVFWNTIPEGITCMDDLRKLPNAVVCAESGSGQEPFLDAFDFVTKKRMSSVIDIVLDLRFGKSLAGVLEPRIAARLQRQNPELKILSVALPEGLQVYGCGIAIRQNNKDLAALTSSLITAMRNDGTLKRLEQKWQLED